MRCQQKPTEWFPKRQSGHETAAPLFLYRKPHFSWGPFRHGEHREIRGLVRLIELDLVIVGLGIGTGGR